MLRRVAHNASSRAQAARTPCSRSTGRGEQSARHPADAFLVGGRGQVLDRRLAVDPGEEQPGQQPRRAPLERAVRLPARRRRDRPWPARRSSGGKLARGVRRPQTFQQQVVQAEREIERRVAVPGALGIEEDRPARPDQDVLRADVAVHEGASGARGGLDQRVQRVGPVRMRPRARDQIRLEPDVVEDPIGGERRRDLAIVGGRGMDAHQAIRRRRERRPGRRGRRAGRPSTAGGRPGSRYAMTRTPAASS